MHLHAHCCGGADLKGFGAAGAEVGFGALMAAGGAVRAVTVVRSGGIAVVRGAVGVLMVRRAV